MSRYRLDYRKNQHLIWGTSWSCTLFDRKTGETFFGNGNSRKEAKEDAFDKVYEFNNGRSDSTFYSSDTYSSPSSNNSDTEIFQTGKPYNSFKFSTIISWVIITCSFVIFMDSFDYFEEGKVRFFKWLMFLTPFQVIIARYVSLLILIIFIIRWLFKKDR
jgi:hypothetical protein